MKFKGTKGKWIVRDEKNSNGFINIDLPNKRFITFYGELKKINDVFPKETKANALLISKAPILLDKHINDIELLENILKENPIGDIAFKLRLLVEEKKQLIKEATQL